MMPWHYLLEKMKLYADRIALAGCGLTYAQILSFGDGKRGHGCIRLCEGASKEDTAIAILKALEEGNVAVPVTKS